MQRLQVARRIPPTSRYHSLPCVFFFSRAERIAKPAISTVTNDVIFVVLQASLKRQCSPSHPCRLSVWSVSLVTRIGLSRKDTNSPTYPGCACIFSVPRLSSRTRTPTLSNQAPPVTTPCIAHKLTRRQHLRYPRPFEREPCH